ncbi:MAG TPA: hypothetical protein VF765_07020 [Polyangiaceae bacterium]
MFRTYLAALGPMAAALSAVATVVVISGTGCSATGVGDPCIPEQEYDPSFGGFDYHEVNVESKSFQCETRLCLVNHFQGRVSCPYGQNAGATGAYLSASGVGEKCNGTKPADTNSACCTPGIYQAVAPTTNVTMGGGDGGGGMAGGDLHVMPNCTDRTASVAVYCSCRCANANGKTDDGANYCTCPDGYDCSQLVAGTGVSGEGNLPGAYCVKHNTAYNPLTSCTGLAGCDPGAKAGTPAYCGPTNTAQ